MSNEQFALKILIYEKSFVRPVRICYLRSRHKYFTHSVTTPKTAVGHILLSIPYAARDSGTRAAKDDIRLLIRSNTRVNE